MEDTGDIPYQILKPALERASAAQLRYIEERNPVPRPFHQTKGNDGLMAPLQYLEEDSDELWERLSGREFKAQLRAKEEDESWKDFYLVCLPSPLLLSSGRRRSGVMGCSGSCGSGRCGSRRSRPG